jgi:hypothetical protein
MRILAIAPPRLYPRIRLDPCGFRTPRAVGVQNRSLSYRRSACAPQPSRPPGLWAATRPGRPWRAALWRRRPGPGARGSALSPRADQADEHARIEHGHRRAAAAAHALEGAPHRLVPRAGAVERARERVGGPGRCKVGDQEVVRAEAPPVKPPVAFERRVEVAAVDRGRDLVRQPLSGLECPAAAHAPKRVAGESGVAEEGEPGSDGGTRDVQELQLAEQLRLPRRPAQIGRVREGVEVARVRALEVCLPPPTRSP